MQITSRDKIAWSSGMQVYQTEYGKRVRCHIGLFPGLIRLQQLLLLFFDASPSLVGTNYDMLEDHSSPPLQPAGNADVELAGFSEGYVLVVNADRSLTSLEMDRKSVGG